tara:strand:+ start:299 stop:703 length:405 start_codon:yes stop_codon:yes gene_type:complete
MIKLHARLFGLVLLALPFFSPAPAVALTLSEKAAIQAFMQRHVDGKLIDGALLYLNQKTDEVQRLHPVTAHPMILTMDEHYVLCFDFRDDGGKTVPVDYYIARRDSEYVVFHTSIAERTLLKRLMSEGKVSRLR